MPTVDVLAIVLDVFATLILVSLVVSVSGLVSKKPVRFWVGFILTIALLIASGFTAVVQAIGYFDGTPPNTFLNNFTSVLIYESVGSFFVLPLLLIIAGVMGIYRRKQLAWRNTAIASFALLIISVVWFSISLSNM